MVGNRTRISGRRSEKGSAASVSSQPMIALEEAQNQILATVPRLPGTTVALGEALGLVTVETLAATEPIPPFANTGVDGLRGPGRRHRRGDAGGARPPPDRRASWPPGGADRRRSARARRSGS